MGLVPLPRRLDHLRGAVDRRDATAIEPLTDQRDRHPMAAADFEQAIGRLDGHHVYRPTKPL
jgi:hypothetical protein